MHRSVQRMEQTKMPAAVEGEGRCARPRRPRNGELGSRRGSRSQIASTKAKSTRIRFVVGPLCKLKWMDLDIMTSTGQCHRYQAVGPPSQPTKRCPSEKCLGSPRWFCRAPADDESRRHYRQHRRRAGICKTQREESGPRSRCRSSPIQLIAAAILHGKHLHHGGCPKGHQPTNRGIPNLV